MIDEDDPPTITLNNDDISTFEAIEESSTLSNHKLKTPPTRFSVTLVKLVVEIEAVLASKSAPPSP